MLNRFLNLPFVMVAFVGCAATDPDEPLTAIPGNITVTEYDRTNKVIGSYFVDGDEVPPQLGGRDADGARRGPSAENYSVDR